jgi:thiol:disulfide interchange protein DsbD
MAALRALALLAAFALGCPSARAHDGLDLGDPDAAHVRAELLAQDDSVAPGQATLLALRLQHAPHWHTYWQMPGDAGLPTQLKWRLEPGFVAGPVQWPVPLRLRVGDLANYGYEGTVLLPVQLQVPASAPLGGKARLALHVDWLVCNDLCIPGSADLSEELPIRSAADVHPSAAAAQIAAARRLVPAPLALDGVRASLQRGKVALEFAGSAGAPHSLEFFPFEPGRIEAAAQQRLHVQGRRVRLDMLASTPVGPDFKALRGVLVADGGPADGGWAGSIDVPLGAAAAAGSADPAAGAPSGGLGAMGSSAGAALAAAPAAAPAAASAAPAVARAAGSVPGEAPLQAENVGSLAGLSIAMAGAFLGGLILNLMPCVFPVLSLKLIALVRHRRVAPQRLRQHGAAYALGVVLSFVALAGLLLALRAAGAQIGWGFQLQSPWVIAALIGLFFLIGLSLLGAFEFTLGAGAIDRVANSAVVDRICRAGIADEAQADDEGLGGSFATGVLAAVVASPCTAPFMGAALGYAVTQTALVALLIFGALGAGMATPYFVLTLVPSWLARLPRPGAWMERLKQIMAFPMFLTCVWLFWVLGQQVGIDAVAAMLAALVGVGLCAWALGLAQRGAPRMRWFAGAAAVATLAGVGPALHAAVQADATTVSGASPAARHAGADTASGDWSLWTQEGQVQALAQGSPVFVDFTAAWCITCQANKRLVLHDERVEAAFRAHGVVRLQADWTRHDESISRELVRLQRDGVPVYVLYDRQGRQHVLPEILSTQAVLDALGAV